METVTQGQLNFMDLPTEILQKILSYLYSIPRKSVRLTCKRLYELCNTADFCAEEVIYWNSMTNYGVLSTFCESTRPYYHLVMRDMIVPSDYIVPFFEKHGSKVYSLSIEYDKFPYGLLESIIQHCKSLCSLSVKFKNYSYIPTLDMEPIIRPSVTTLRLSMTNADCSSITFYNKIVSIFTNLNRLNIKIKELQFWLDAEKTCSNICDIIGKLRCLESLKLAFFPNSFLQRGSQFFDTFSNLKNLCLDCGTGCLKLPSSNRQELISFLQRLSSIELHNLMDCFEPEIILPLLHSDKLKFLTLSPWKLSEFSPKIMQDMVLSKLKIVKFIAPVFVVPLCSALKMSAVINETITDLTLLSRYELKSEYFAASFGNLVHLQLYLVSNAMLQGIFRFQKNLRSLFLDDCSQCSISGYFGSDEFAYSINNLHKLEHLTIKKIDGKIIYFSSFKTRFHFRGLKYLKIEVFWSGKKSVIPEMPIEVFIGSLINLEAIRLRYFAIPSYDKLLLLYYKLPRLKFLRFDTIRGDCCIIIDQHYFPVKVPDCADELFFDRQMNYYDEVIDRIILWDIKSVTGCEKIWWKPKVSSFVIDWITLNDESDILNKHAIFSNFYP